MINHAVAAAAQHGQSIWLDDLSRDLLATGELAKVVDEGISGVTTNPSIFERAVTASGAYDAAIAGARSAGRIDVLAVCEGLIIDDIRRAADILLPTYRRTAKIDGFVSLEVRPALSSDAEAIFQEACRIWGCVARPNLMIKVPATPEGIAAIPRLIRVGVNVNATLIFSTEVYRRVAAAWLDGLDARLAAGLEIASTASVASFFVSRIDARVDELLVTRPDADPGRDRVRGCVALALASLAYDAYRGILTSARWARLSQAGARPQRLLWASVGSKDPAAPPTRYVRRLVYPGTVSTLPLDTYRRFRSEAAPDRTLHDARDADAVLAALKGSGIDMGALSDGLLAEGLARFGRSFDRLLEAVRTKIDAVGSPGVGRTSG